MAVMHDYIVPHKPAALKTLPKVGEIWFVRFTDAACVSKIHVKWHGERVYQLSGLEHYDKSAYYEIDVDVTFIEKVL